MPNERRRRTSNRKRIEQLRRQIEEVAGAAWFGSGECAPEIEERFLERVLAFEKADSSPLFDRLVQAGVLLPSPDALTDQEIYEKLWEVIRALELMGAYLEFDDLSDREAYAHLWYETLRESTVLMPNDPAYAMHIDLVSSGSDEDIAIYLRYYADEETRQHWAREFPDLPIPAHEEPPHDRDRLLPQRDWNVEPGNA